MVIVSDLHKAAHRVWFYELFASPTRDADEGLVNVKLDDLRRRAGSPNKIAPGRVELLEAYDAVYRLSLRAYLRGDLRIHRQALGKFAGAAAAFEKLVTAGSNPYRMSDTLNMSSRNASTKARLRRVKMKAGRLKSVGAALERLAMRYETLRNRVLGIAKLRIDPMCASALRLQRDRVDSLRLSLTGRRPSAWADIAYELVAHVRMTTGGNHFDLISRLVSPLRQNAGDGDYSKEAIEQAYLRGRKLGAESLEWVVQETAVDVIEACLAIPLRRGAFLKEPSEV